jgi:hypothetical protein
MKHIKRCELGNILAPVNEAGGKWMTTGKGTPHAATGGRGKVGPQARVKFGSTSVPIYLLESKERRHLILAQYHDGKRIRRVLVPELLMELIAARARDRASKT